MFALAAAAIGITPAELAEWVHYDAQDRAYRATLTAAQLRDYRRHIGEIEYACPACGATDVELAHDDFADMVGTTYVTTFKCCGYARSANAAIEYDAAGRMVDVR